MATPATLPSLPIELLYQISEQLSYTSHIALSFTCRKLYVKLDTPRRLSALPGRDKAYTMEDLLEMEEWPEHSPRHPTLNKLYVVKTVACRICLKLLGRDKFFNFWEYYYTRANIPESMKDIIILRKQGQLCLPCTLANRLPQYNQPDEFYTGYEADDYLELARCLWCAKYFPRMHYSPGSGACETCQYAMAVSAEF
ncbi:hypothetical protein V494_05766 [Pseudogymnoascus sp. VKM F-4513 (FW-928)]|nr:hypothetical protein V494_05766 [Pseudogymnoascus sp. VKM F-4513 (FW-928)]